MLVESFAKKSDTGHILGGAVIVANSDQRVIDTRHLRSVLS
jgi:hypothetical protein